MIDICICEDDDVYARKVKKFIYEYYDDVVVHICDDRTMDFDTEYDLYILDIELHQKDGFELSKDIIHRYPNAYMIVLSSHDEYVKKGYFYKMKSFVSKEFFNEEFRFAMDRAMEVLRKQKAFIEVRSSGISKVIRITDIDYIQSDCHYLMLGVGLDSYRVRMSFSEFEEKYPDNSFICTIRGQYVNVNSILSVDKNRVQLKNNRWVDLSRLNYKKVKKAYVDHTISNM